MKDLIEMFVEAGCADVRAYIQGGNVIFSAAQLLRTGQLKAAAEVVECEAMPVFDLRGKRPGYTTVVIKEAITLCGLEVGPPRPPLAPLAEADREELRRLLRQLGILKSQTA